MASVVTLNKPYSRLDLFMLAFVMPVVLYLCVIFLCKMYKCFEFVSRVDWMCVYAFLTLFYLGPFLYMLKFWRFSVYPAGWFRSVSGSSCEGLSRITPSTISSPACCPSRGRFRTAGLFRWEFHRPRSIWKYTVGKQLFVRINCFVKK